MNIHIVAPVLRNNFTGNEGRLIVYLNTPEGKSTGVNYVFSDLRQYPHALEHFYEEFDATIVFKGEMLTPQDLNLMGGVKILYFPDDILVYPAYARMIKYVGKYYDIVYTFDSEAIPRFQELGCTNVKWWPSATGDDIFYDRGLERNIDICFIGTIDNKRRIFLDKVQEEFPGKNIMFKQGIRGHEYAKVMNHSKIVLNLGQGNSGLSQRIFEASACGALVITNHVKDIDTLFKHNEIVTYKYEIELLATIDFYLTHNEERKAQAEKGHKEVMINHLMKNRFAQMLIDINEFKNNATSEVVT